MTETKIALIQIALSLVVYGCWFLLWKVTGMNDTQFLILVMSVLYVSIMFWIIRTRSDR